ncbi:MAG: hypothetical protein KatS3mg001_158 [Candidatus Pacearchaeota archaeon]|nr:MAG: hypothetical protein KatS3mg001_158 [Candidatus Pacearchaeota archaeon]
MNKKIKEKPLKKFLKESFWSMIFLWILLSLLPDSITLITLTLLILLTISTFVLSIINLTKYKKKEFPTVSLIISLFIFLILVISFSLGVLVGLLDETTSSNKPTITKNNNELIFINETNNHLDEGYYNSFVIFLQEPQRLFINLSSNNPLDIYLLNENEYLRYQKGDSFYAISSYKEIKYMRSFPLTKNTPLQPETYYIVVSNPYNTTKYNITVLSTS